MSVVIKSDSEIEKMRIAGQLLQVLTMIGTHVIPGISA